MPLPFAPGHPFEIPEVFLHSQDDRPLFVGELWIVQKDDIRGIADRRGVRSVSADADDLRNAWTARPGDLTPQRQLLNFEVPIALLRAMKTKAVPPYPTRTLAADLELER